MGADVLQLFGSAGEGRSSHVFHLKFLADVINLVGCMALQNDPLLAIEEVVHLLCILQVLIELLGRLLLILHAQPIST